MSEENLIKGLYDLESKHSELGACMPLYLEVCKNLDTASKKHQAAVERLNAIVRFESDGSLADAVKLVSETHRDCGLLMLESARHLSRMGSKCLSLSAVMADLASEENEA